MRCARGWRLPAPSGRSVSWLSVMNSSTRSVRREKLAGSCVNWRRRGTRAGEEGRGGARGGGGTRWGVRRKLGSGWVLRGWRRMPGLAGNYHTCRIAGARGCMHMPDPAIPAITSTNTTKTPTPKSAPPHLVALEPQQPQAAQVAEALRQPRQLVAHQVEGAQAGEREQRVRHCGARGEGARGRDVHQVQAPARTRAGGRVTGGYRTLQRAKAVGPYAHMHSSA